MDFPMDFWLFHICFINVLFKVITGTNFQFDICFIKDYLWNLEAYLNHMMVSCAPKKSIG